MNDITKSRIWQQLSEHYKQIAQLHMRDLFEDNPERFNKFSITIGNEHTCSLLIDYSKNRITSETINLLCELAKTANLSSHIEQMFRGQTINTTEQRAVLHTALRNPSDAAILLNGEDIMLEIRSTLTKMLQCAENIKHGKWKGYSGKPITDVVNIGIGGSDLGPKMAVSALTPYISNNIKCHFVSNIDGTHISETLKYLNPETTLFIIASKTFTTPETLCNASTAKEWLEQKANSKNMSKKHLIAVTANPQRAIEFGINKNNIYPFWDWVGGRYSLWSAIGLSIAIAIGADNFQQLLAGAHAMDNHFRNTSFEKNIPVIMALIGIWNINFFNCKTHAILPYDQYLHLLPAYLQQLEMESNGKHVRMDGSPIEYTTAPVIWGSVGTNGQHVFHQLLLQGTQTVPVDFIIPIHTHNPIGQHHMLLFANCLAQSKALMQGKTEQQVIQELIDQGINEADAKKLAPHKVIPGNVPSNTILIDKMTPYTLGALIALYEHKVFVQGIIWGINSFDQWGVELGKQLTKNIIPCLQDPKHIKNLDSSTRGLIKYYLQ